MAAKKQKPEKKFVTAKDHVFGEWQNLTKSQIIKEINSACKKVPSEYRDSIRFCIAQEYTDPYSDSTMTYLTIQWERLETDDEFRKRVEQEEKFKLQNEIREREEFERLSKKFANG